MGLPLHARAESCGKVILLGEHSVVYGHPALALGLPQGLALSASPLADEREHCRLRIPAWNLDLTLEPDSRHPVARACLEVLTRCDGPVLGWAIEGRTSLPAGAGLGSSAALSVALARLVLGADADVDEVVAASLAGERVFHGDPSGLDSEVAARGGALTFVRGGRPEPIALSVPLEIVVVVSGLPRSTAEQVAIVRARRDRLARLVDPLLRTLAECVQLGRTALETSKFEELGEIMAVAHEVLSALGVSTPRLDELCAAARARGALGAKLTGAGGGGSIVALARPGEARRLAERFAEDGLHAFSVEVESP